MLAARSIIHYRRAVTDILLHVSAFLVLSLIEYSVPVTLLPSWVVLRDWTYVIHSLAVIAAIAWRISLDPGRFLDFVPILCVLVQCLDWAMLQDVEGCILPYSINLLTLLAGALIRYVNGQVELARACQMTNQQLNTPQVAAEPAMPSTLTNATPAKVSATTASAAPSTPVSKPMDAKVTTSAIQSVNEADLRKQIESQIRQEWELQARQELETTLRRDLERELRKNIEQELRHTLSQEIKAETEQLRQLALAQHAKLTALDSTLPIVVTPTPTTSDALSLRTPSAGTQGNLEFVFADDEDDDEDAEGSTLRPNTNRMYVQTNPCDQRITPDPVTPHSVCSGGEEGDHDVEHQTLVEVGTQTEATADQAETGSQTDESGLTSQPTETTGDMGALEGDQYVPDLASTSTAMEPTPEVSHPASQQSETYTVTQTGTTDSTPPSDVHEANPNELTTEAVPAPTTGVPSLPEESMTAPTAPSTPATSPARKPYQGAQLALMRSLKRQYEEKESALYAQIAEKEEALRAREHTLEEKERTVRLHRDEVNRARATLRKHEEALQAERLQLQQDRATNVACATDLEVLRSDLAAAAAALAKERTELEARELALAERERNLIEENITLEESRVRLLRIMADIESRRQNSEQTNSLLSQDKETTLHGEFERFKSARLEFQSLMQTHLDQEDQQEQPQNPQGQLQDPIQLPQVREQDQEQSGTYDERQ